MEAEDINEFNGGSEETPLEAEEIAQVRAVLGSLGNLEETIHTLQRDQGLMFEAVAKFANRTEQRQQENLNEIKANHELLERVINQFNQFAQQNETRQCTQESVIAKLQSEVMTLRDQVQVLATKGPNAVDTTSQSSAKSEEESDEVWDVYGTMPPHTPEYNAHELEQLVDKCHKQRETPMYGGEPNEDIEVYVLNMIRWYAAYQLYFHREQVDVRVGQLMMNHTKGKAKAWLLQEYQGEHRWSHIIRKMKKRFVTKSRQEDLVAKFFDCVQGNRSLDMYSDEFRRLARTAGASEYIKILRFKQGLSSTQLLHLLKTKTFDTLDGLIEASRTLNPRESGKPTEKGGAKSTKTPKPSFEKKSDPAKCTSSRCTEKGHTKDRCWMLHPDLQPQWLKDSQKKKGKGAAGVSKTSVGGENSELMSMLSTIQSDIAKLKGDLN